MNAFHAHRVNDTADRHITIRSLEKSLEAIAIAEEDRESYSLALLGALEGAGVIHKMEGKLKRKAPIEKSDSKKPKLEKDTIMSNLAYIQAI